MITDYDADAPAPAETDAATFGLGCFWGPDARFGALEGIVRTRVGYAGGTESDPTYRDLGDHTEVLQVDYDPDDLTYADLLDVVFESHEPYHQSGKRQYQNVVLYETDDQREALDRYLDERGFDPDAVATRIEALDEFTLAEDLHQKYRLKSTPLLERFEGASYDEAAVRESPAASKLNGVAGGHDLPAGNELASLVEGKASR